MLVVPTNPWNVMRFVFAGLVIVAWVCLVVAYLGFRRNVNGPVVLSIIALTAGVGTRLFPSVWRKDQ